MTSEQDQIMGTEFSQKISNHKVELQIDEKQDYQNTLIQEYEICQRDAHVLEGNIWNTASLFIGLSLAGISLLTQLNIEGFAEFLVLLTVAIVSSSILILWQRILKRWYYIRAVWYYRMEEIEQQLGMWRERYLKYLNRANRGEINPEEEEEFHFRYLYESVSKHHVRRTRYTLDTIIYLLVGSWIVFLIYAFLQLLSTPDGHLLVDTLKLWLAR